jgi:uncharacterized membrane protein required for colicin V production
MGALGALVQSFVLGAIDKIAGFCGGATTAIGNFGTSAVTVIKTFVSG